MKVFFFLAGLQLCIISFAQKDPKLIEAELKKHFQKIYFWTQHPKIDDSTDTYDSLQRANNFILETIVKHGRSNEAFLIFPFDSITDDLTITTSEDQSLRIYSWDTYTGGTMHIFYAVAQFFGGDKKVYTKMLSDTTDADAGLWYSDTYTFNNKGKKYYFCIGNAIYSTHDLAQQIEVYTTNNNTLVRAPIIKTKTGLTSSIHVDYDLFNLGGDKEQSITFDKETKEIKIPVVDEKGKMLKKNIIYRFTGSYFEKKTIE